MRDILVTLIVFGSLPLIFKRPWLGAIMWIWISVMNLHSQGWGFARTMPFAAIIACATVASMILSKDKHRLPPSPVTTMFILFGVWVGVTTIFAINGAANIPQLTKVYKILGMNLVVMMLIRTREQVEALVWCVALSLGFYGIKGGIFTIRSGGNELVWGPAGTFIEGNNELALALVMVIPIIYYLFTISTRVWLRVGLIGAMLLCALSALGSYSRGAALAIGAMAVFLWLKSRHKFTLGVLMLAAVPLMLAFMPEKWFDRIDTISEYETDGSAQGRINAWHMAYNLALDRPIVGGGFDIYDYGVFLRYAPVPDDVHAAHSLYFQVLGEHGFVGLFIYLALAWCAWRAGSRIIRDTKPYPDLRWASDLATMLQVSMLGFGVGGAFLSLVYFDVPYYLMGAMVATSLIVAAEIKEKKKLKMPAPAVLARPEAAAAAPLRHKGSR